MNRGRNIIGLYTQLIWAKTLYVGCGISMYKDVEKPNMYLKFFVCNYGPRGNVVGESVYQKGPPCSKCSQGCSQDDRYKSLCKNEQMEINTEKKLFVTIRVNEVDEISKNHKPITKNRTPIQRPIGRLQLNNYSIIKSNKYWTEINDLTKFYINEPIMGQTINASSDSFIVYLKDTQFERLSYYFCFKARFSILKTISLQLYQIYVILTKT